MKTNQVRQLFKDYFISKGHASVASSSLIPSDDPTLLFTNAGMVQFKNVFLGTDKRDYARAVTVQKCIRAGGKHNDLENVGYTARHHTFFEMLGNFSFGNYFKRDAILYAWEFLTEVVKLPKEKLWISVFAGDSETEKLWINEIGVDPKRISRIGAKDNFWSMGDIGPCGPCTEIFYDHGEGVAGGPPGSPDEDGDRYIEIWNVVFMQHNRQADETLEDLPNPSVDTGMGLERIAAILQGVHNNYDIDLFQTLIKEATKILEVDDLSHASLKVIADHIRSCSFLIVDGIMPSNEGRGYVLRRIIRRAARHGFQLGAKAHFFHRLVPVLVSEMGDAYPELVENKEKIIAALKREEAQFSKTLDIGMKLFEQNLDQIVEKEIPGDLAFKLYDTYGFPFDLTADVAREKGLTVDEAGFNKCMEAQRNRAKSASQFSIDYNDVLNSESKTEFLGYSAGTTESKILELYKDGQPVAELKTGEEGIIVLNETPFYAESGGQVSDHGVIETFGSKFDVYDVQKNNQAVFHYGKVVAGELAISDEVTAMIELARREEVAHNHSATHLLHAALRQVLGERVEQKGSHVDDDRLRFDFTHLQAVTEIELSQVERLVNQQIRNNFVVETIVTTPERATEMGAMALFGEKYGDMVRVLRMGDFSIELCGGTHVRQTGDIGYFRMTSETGIASGIRRIEAVTGNKAEKFALNKEATLKQMISLLKATSSTAIDKLEKLIAMSKGQEKEISRLKTQIASGISHGASQDVMKKIGNVLVYAKVMPEVDMKIMREHIDQLKSKHNNIIIILGTADDGKVQLAAGVSKAISGNYKAGVLINHVAKQVGGKGGGRPDMAQAGGTDPEKLDEAIESAYQWVENQLVIS